MKSERISSNGICCSELTSEEFELLGYLDARLYIDSAISRFTGWHSSFDAEHPDWMARVQVQRQLAECFSSAYQKGEFEPRKDRPTRVLFLGASLGSIATFFFLIQWRRHFGDLPFELHILDLLREPLEQTQRGNFEMTEEALADCDEAGIVTANDYREVLRTCTVHTANIVALPHDIPTFDITIAPYVHHHLNFYDKRLACTEMERVTTKGGLLLVGDLTFIQTDFNEWLRRHEVEIEHYAIESFISKEEHKALFDHATLIVDADDLISYAMCMRNW